MIWEHIQSKPIEASLHQNILISDFKNSYDKNYVIRLDISIDIAY